MSPSTASTNALRNNNIFRNNLNLKSLGVGILALLTTLPIALLIQVINNRFIKSPEKIVMICGVFFIFILAIPPITYLIYKRRNAELGILGLIILTTISILLVSTYIYWVYSYVRFPADILIWSETDFIKDILKFRIGYPIYSAQVNNESFIYVPGAQLLTYLIAWLSGNSTSIPAYRLIQLLYTLIGALFAFLTFRRLLELGNIEHRVVNWKLWGAFGLLFFSLIATNSLTNPFVQDLHDDALAQLLSIIAYYLLITYVITRKKYVLTIMVLFPGISFLVKQSLIVWALFYLIYLALFDRKLSIRQLITFSAISFAFIGLVIFGCYLLWGDPFIYWTFTVLSKHGVSILRSFQHGLDIWVYFSLGLLGGVVLVRGKNIKILLGLWLIWLLLIAQETYTSGIAWMINHIGPGSLIASIWFLAGLARIWPMIFSKDKVIGHYQNWINAGTVIIIMSFLFYGLGTVRIPLPPLGEDAYRYVNEIESQFQGQNSSDILLDFGSWVYIEDNVIMKDQAPSIGDRGFSGIGDFSGIIQRLQQHTYSKILVRDLDSPTFTYDYYLWPSSSGIKQVLLSNYHVIGEINGVEGIDNYLFGDISILVPIGN
jgi:hypothetical protein